MILKRVLTIFGGLLILGGLVWILQGVGVLPGSFMSGHLQWAYNGGILAVIGLALIIGANWRRSAGPPKA